MTEQAGERVDRVSDPVETAVVVEECPWCGDQFADGKCSRNCHGWRRDSVRKVERRG